MYKKKPSRLPNMTPKHCAIQVKPGMTPTEESRDWWYFDYEVYRKHRTFERVEWTPPKGSDFVFPDWLLGQLVAAGENPTKSNVNLLVWNVIENVPQGTRKLDWGWVEPAFNEVENFETAYDAIERIKKDPPATNTFDRLFQIGNNSYSDSNGEIWVDGRKV
jgi:hypothetical protein